MKKELKRISQYDLANYFYKNTENFFNTVEEIIIFEPYKKLNFKLNISLKLSSFSNDPSIRVTDFSFLGRKIYENIISSVTKNEKQKDFILDTVYDNPTLSFETLKAIYKQNKQKITQTTQTTNKK